MTSIWEIIPKITSPLAVLSFAIYIFYLFKQSSDRKKESSLKVSDPKAQRRAVELILKDNPDISIDRIRDPAGALELAKKVVDDRLKRYHKTLNTLLIFSGIFALTFLISLVITSLLPSNEDDKKTFFDKSSQSWAEKQAIRGRKPYALLFVIQHIKLEDIISADSTKKRKAEFRNYYTLKALKDITRQDNVFEEQFLSSIVTIKPWPGSEIQEVESIVDGRYWVKFDTKKNDVITVTTGADYLYPIPIPHGGGTSCFGDIHTSDKEWMTCYPNSEDYIDKITIIVEGENMDLSLPPNAAMRKNQVGAVAVSDGTCKIYSTNDHCTLVSKWERLNPGECVNFKINWSLPKN